MILICNYDKDGSHTFVTSTFSQNAAARLITGSRKSDHVIPLLKELHWLPVTQRVLYNLLVNVYKALNLIGPMYLYELLVPYCKGSVCTIGVITLVVKPL